MNDKEKAYVESLEESIDRFIEMWDDQDKAQATGEDYEWASEKIESIMKRIRYKDCISSYNHHDEFICEMKKLLARFRRIIQNETMIARLANIENRRLKMRMMKKDTE